MMYIKRGLDLAGAIFLLVLLSPAFIICALLIKIDSSGPVFFRQDRVGLHGRIFRIYKFRTMVATAVQMGAGLATYRQDPRITRIGRVLRKYRLDEFPQLINVIKGEMSLVGPRPLLPQHLEAYSETDRKRLLMPAGMTGWQQVNGGSLNSWEERIALDVCYVENWNLWLDLVVLLRTFLVVLKADTVYGKDGWQRSGIPSCPVLPQEIRPSQHEQKQAL